MINWDEPIEVLSNSVWHIAKVAYLGKRVAVISYEEEELIYNRDTTAPWVRNKQKEPMVKLNTTSQEYPDYADDLNERCVFEYEMMSSGEDVEVVERLIEKLNPIFWPSLYKENKNVQCDI